MKRKQSVSCEFCGVTVHGPLHVIKVEGALLNVCNNCTRHGKVVEKTSPTTAPVKKPVSRPVRTSRPPVRRTVSTKKPATGEKVLDEDYPDIIKNARSKLKLTQMDLAKKTGISHAQIQSFETGRIRPTDREVKKIERALNVTLTTELDLNPEFGNVRGVRETTLGDIVKFTKKR